MSLNYQVLARILRSEFSHNPHPPYLITLNIVPSLGPSSGLCEVLSAWPVSSKHPAGSGQLAPSHTPVSSQWSSATLHPPSQAINLHLPPTPHTTQSGAQFSTGIVGNVLCFYQYHACLFLASFANSPAGNPTCTAIAPALLTSLHFSFILLTNP